MLQMYMGELERTVPVANRRAAVQFNASNRTVSTHAAFSH